MKTIKSVYKIGHGPSSSHTVGPFRAAQIFGERCPGADEYRVTLYGSLAFTGEGHGTEKAVRSGLPGIKVIFDRKTQGLPHPNTMLFEAFRSGECIGADRIFSIGGGSIRIENEESDDELEVYRQKNFTDILKICRDRSLNLAQFIYRLEDPSLRDYLKTVWEAMKASVQRGLAAEGILPGGLGVARKAKTLYETRCYNESADVTMNRIIAAYAYAVSEENADENIVVTAPTCGSCGVLPAVMYYMHSERGFPEEEILDALAVAALIGNVIRTNASISGAACGCPVRAEHRPDRIRRGDRDGTRPRPHLRPGQGTGADPLHRAQRRRRDARHQLRQPLALPLLHAQDLLRRGRRDNVPHGPRHGRKIPRDLPRRPGADLLRELNTAEAQSSNQTI